MRFSLAGASSSYVGAALTFLTLNEFFKENVCILSSDSPLGSLFDCYDNCLLSNILSLVYDEGDVNESIDASLFLRIFSLYEECERFDTY